MSKVLVVYSGGMDSFTTLHRAIVDQFDAMPELGSAGAAVMAVSFDYGQRHRKELDFAAAECKRLEIEHLIIPLDFGKLLKGSALTDDIPVPEGHYADENMKLTVVPNRNMIMLSIAAGIAVANGIEKIYCGVHAGDHAIYPDCRPVFIEAMVAALNVGNYGNLGLIAPWLYVDKRGILEWGLNVGLNYGHSWTCYKGGEHACGKCGSCVERLEAFAHHGVEDPLQYETV